MNRLRYILLRPYLPLALLMLVACVTALSIYSSNSSHNSTPADQTIEPLTARNGGIKIYSKAILVHPYRDYWKNHPPEMEEFEPMKPIPFSELKSTSGFWARFDFAIPDPGNTYYFDTKYYYRETLPAFITCYDDFTRRPELEPITPIYRATPAYKIQTAYNRCTLIVPSRLPYFQNSGAKLSMSDTYFAAMRNQSLFYAGIFSVLLLIILYVTGLSIYARSRFVLFYLLSLVAYLLYQLSLTGYHVDLGLIPPELNEGFIRAVTFWQLFLLWFFLELFEKLRPNRFLRFFRLSVGVVSGLCSLFGFLLHPNETLIIMEFHSYVLLFMILLVAFFGLFFRGIQGAIAFFSFLWVVAGVIVFAFTNAGILPLTLWTKHAPLLGSTIEMVILSVFLGFRMRQMQASRIESDLSSRAGSAVQKRAQGYRRQLEEHLIGTAAAEVTATLEAIQKSSRMFSKEEARVFPSLAALRNRADQLVQSFRQWHRPRISPAGRGPQMLAITVEEMLALESLHWHSVFRFANRIEPGLILNLNPGTERDLQALLADFWSACQKINPTSVALKSDGPTAEIQLHLEVRFSQDQDNQQADLLRFKERLDSKQEEYAELGRVGLSLDPGLVSLKIALPAPTPTPGNMPANDRLQNPNDSGALKNGIPVALISKDPILLNWIPALLPEECELKIRTEAKALPEEGLILLDLQRWDPEKDVPNINRFLNSLGEEQTTILLLNGRLPFAEQAAQDTETVLDLDPALDRIILRPCSEETLLEGIQSALGLCSRLRAQKANFLIYKSRSEGRIQSSLRRSVGRQIQSLQEIVNREAGFNHSSLEQLDAGIDEAQLALRRLLEEMGKGTAK